MKCVDQTILCVELSCHWKSEIQFALKMTVRVNRIEKYWECCKVESECSWDKKGEILLKKAVLAILIAGMAVLTACGNNNTVKNDDNVYKYSDYEYKDEAQFYMKKMLRLRKKGIIILQSLQLAVKNINLCFTTIWLMPIV